MSDSDIREQLREKYYQEGKERALKHKQDRLNKIFSDLGDNNDLYLYFHDYKLETLDKIRSSVESGDKKAMLALLVITADALDAFEVLPEDVRKALAESLQKMRINLEESRGFLPRGRGKRSKREKREQSNKEFWTAYAVECYRIYDGYSLEDARALVSEKKGLTESSVHKAWKREHKKKKKTLSIKNIIRDLSNSKIKS